MKFAVLFAVAASLVFAGGFSLTKTIAEQHHDERERLYHCFECGFLYHAGDQKFRRCEQFREACGECYPLVQR